MATKNYKSNGNNYLTPKGIFQPILNFVDLCYFSIDVCCSTDNVMAHEHFYKGYKDGLKENWAEKDLLGMGEIPSICFMNPPWVETAKWIKKAFHEVEINNIEVWAVLPADRLNKVYFNEILREHNNWFMAILQDGGGQKFNFYNPDISEEENQKNINNGGFSKPIMLLYIGKNHKEYKARWTIEQPLKSLVLS